MVRKLRRRRANRGIVHFLYTAEMITFAVLIYSTKTHKNGKKQKSTVLQS